MSHAYTAKGEKRYRYYVCNKAQGRGRDSCPSKSIPAGEIEPFVVEQIRCIGRDERLVAETVRQAQRQTDASIKQLATEQAALMRELKRHHAELQQVAGDPAKVAHVADLHERIRTAERRASEVAIEVDGLQRGRVDARDVATALAQFDPVWDALSPREQARVIQLLVERVDYDGCEGQISITFHPTGIRALAAEAASTGEAA
jgi:site-specific DNA recombinase